MAENRVDYTLFASAAILILFGILILAGAGAAFSVKNFGSATAYLFHQIIFALIPGIILGILAFSISLKFFKRWAPFFLLINIFLLALAFLPWIGVSLGGASRWIAIGPILFQPAEFLKLTFVLYLSAWFASRLGRERSAYSRNEIFQKGLWAFLIMVAVITVFLVLQPDISTLGIIIATVFLVYFVARTPLSHTLAMMIFGIITLGILVGLAPYRMDRLLVFLNPSLDPTGKGYQIQQALIMTGSGELTGLGLGGSQEYLQFLPAAISDAIFAVLAQETGFIGSILVITLFLILCWRGIKIAKGTNDEFRRLLALGITSWIGLQAFVNIGSITGLLPLAGIPLPFLAYGGSHLITEMVGIGLLLNISKGDK